jgi:predicted DNA-binding transcriptional regulator AlpA
VQCNNAQVAIIVAMGMQRTDIITEKELAKELNLSLRHLINLRNERLLPYIKLGRRLIRYDRHAVAAAIQKLTVRELA